MSEMDTSTKYAVPAGTAELSTKRPADAVLRPRAWQMLPVRKGAKGVKDGAIWVWLGINTAAAVVFVCLFGMEGEETGVAISVMLWLLSLPVLWIAKIVRNRLKMLKEEELVTESYGEACVLLDVKTRKRRVRIPDAYRGMKITEVRGGFARKRKFHTVIVPVGVEMLSEGLFARCGKLTHVQLPTHMKQLPANLLERCRKLEKIVIPMLVEEIGSRAFADCKALRDVYVTAGTRYISPDAFDGCTDMMFHVQEGSEAERYAQEHGINYSYT